jgi:prolycopene isomerase
VTPHAVVIGSGIGGSAAALLLSHAGIPVTLIEKNRRVGGSCSGYEKQGFHIDIGTHMFCRGPAGPLGEVLRRAGLPRVEDALRFRRTRDIAEVRIVTRRAAGRGGRAGEELVCVPVPADLHRMPRFVWDMVRALRLSPREAARAAHLFSRALTMPRAEIAAWDHRTVEEFVTRFTDHAPTIGVFGFLLGLYFILPYWEVSAGEALWSFQRMVRDNWLSYPLGGSIAIPSTYCRLAEARGAQVRCGTGVRRVVVERDEGRGEVRVRGVELADGSFLPASIVVSTSSVRTTVSHLVGEEHFPPEYAARARALRGSYIAVQAKIALRRPLVRAGALVGGVGDDIDLFSMGTADLKRMFEAVRGGRVPPVVPFYCPVPSNFDPALAPPGHQLLTVCAVAPTSDVPLADPPAAWEESMLRAVRRVVPSMREEDILFIDRFSVEFIERWIGKEFGPAVSTGQTPDQVGARRPKVHTPIRGLYLAGCNAGGRGVGTELAAQSAMECVDQILADLGRPLLARPGARPAPRLPARRSRALSMSDSQPQP